MTALILQFNKEFPKGDGDGDRRGVVGTRLHIGMMDTEFESRLLGREVAVRFREAAGSNPAADPLNTLDIAYFNILLAWVIAGVMSMRTAVYFARQMEGIYASS